MENTKLVAAKMKIIPKLKLGIRTKQWNQLKKKEVTVVVPTGPHHVKIISDKLVNGKDPETKKPRQEMQYILEEKGLQYQYCVPLYAKESTPDNLIPHYLIEQFMTVQEGDELILEMRKSGLNNYIEVRKINEATPVTTEETSEDVDAQILAEEE